MAARLRASGAACAVIFALALLTGCSSSGPAGPSTYESYLVDASGAGDFTTIQEGLNAASDGDTVYVAAGTYTGPGNRNLTFGGASVVLKGLATRDETVIDCQGQGRGFYIVGSESPVIENLMVTNGDTIRGGGMYLEGASPVLRNVRFVENRATDGGGGIYCRNSSPALTGLLFDDNTSLISGGAMLCVNGSSPAVTNTVFFRNSAGGSGGAIACIFSSPAVSHCVFRRNSAGLGGGVYCAISAPAIASCTFVENEGAEGAGICCRDGSSPSITNSIVAYSAPGEALSCSDGSNPFTTLCCIYENGEENALCGTYTTSMLYEDPVFCDLEGGDLTLSSDSPCLPGNNSWGVQIGAHGLGCGECGSLVLRESWGSVKSLFR